MRLEDLLPPAGPRWERKRQCLPKQVLFAHTVIVYFDTPSDTFSFIYFAYWCQYSSTSTFSSLLARIRWPWPIGFAQDVIRKGDRVIRREATITQLLGECWKLFRSECSRQPTALQPTDPRSLAALAGDKQLEFILSKASIFVCFIMFNLLHPLTH